MPVDNVIQQSSRSVLQADRERTHEIQAAPGRLHFSAPDLESAVAQYRKWFKLADGVPIVGRFQAWRNGVEQGDWRNVDVELASRAEQRARAAKEAECTSTSGQPQAAKSSA